ncbi:MAG: hypothetical protein HY660_00800 [Armatimonadetes bacterium]|nr:hypothetical protein [Armatimonadota bacterium]
MRVLLAAVLIITATLVAASGAFAGNDDLNTRPLDGHTGFVLSLQSGSIIVAATPTSMEKNRLDPR